MPILLLLVAPFLILPSCTAYPAAGSSAVLAAELGWVRPTPWIECPCEARWEL